MHSVGPTVSRQHRSHMTYQRRRQHSTSPPQRTFQLCDFYYLFGQDAHYSVFIQRESNSIALENLERNLHHESAKPSTARFLPRVYTEADIANIQASCLDILSSFGGTCDLVSYLAVTGKIHIKPCDPNMTAEEVAEWFEKRFSCRKYPDWRRLGGKVFDLEAERYEPHQDSDDVGKWTVC